MFLLNKKDTYMRISDPKLVYLRMLQDAARLRDWAERVGSENHKAFTRELERILIFKQPLFTADLTAAEPAPQTTSAQVDREHAVQKSILAKHGITEAPPVPQHILDEMARRKAEGLPDE